mmetsp:Transcript_72381/g.121496  ORF Transcript_72381/g.121496 Transcript_72381/m.121496 type:complete len:275 (+) Transcript_72381:1855-2679(+)
MLPSNFCMVVLYPSISFFKDTICPLYVLLRSKLSRSFLACSSVSFPTCSSSSCFSSDSIARACSPMSTSCRCCAAPSSTSRFRRSVSASIATSRSSFSFCSFSSSSCRKALRVRRVSFSVFSSMLFWMYSLSRFSLMSARCALSFCSASSSVFRSVTCSKNSCSRLAATARSALSCPFSSSISTASSRCASMASFSVCWSCCCCCSCFFKPLSTSAFNRVISSNACFCSASRWSCSSMMRSLRLSLSVDNTICFSYAFFSLRSASLAYCATKTL